jgi:hypothetical protein
MFERGTGAFSTTQPARATTSEVVFGQPGIDVRAPISRPGHAAEGEEEDDEAGDRARDRMQIAPEDAARGRAADAEDAAGLLPWPPEIDAGNDQNQGKAGNDLDQPVGPFPEIFEAVDTFDDPAELLL